MLRFRFSAAVIAREHGRFPLALRRFCSVRKLRILARRRPRRMRPAAARHPLGHHVRGDGACARCRTEPAGASHLLNELLLQCGREPPRHQMWSGNVPDRGRLSPRAARSGASTAGTASECRRGTARRCSAGRIVCSGEEWGVRPAGDRNRGRLRSVTGCGVTPATRRSDESPSLHLAWRSRGDTRVAIHPSTSVSSHPTVFVVSWRLHGNCPRHSRRQSVVRDSPVRAQTSRHRRRRAGERPACAGCSDASVPSSLTRAFLTSADATRWGIKVATLCAAQ